MTLHLFGIRHHGPGSSRALTAALQELQPDLILIEGPPEGEECLNLLDDPWMKPPVAMLVYPTDEPQNAVFYPYAIFSPEWAALQFARKNNIPLRLIDLPWKNRFALDRKRKEELEDLLSKIDPPVHFDLEENISEEDAKDEENKSDRNREEDDPLKSEKPVASESFANEKEIGRFEANVQGEQENAEMSLSRLIREDPLAILARTAGYEEHESWWDHVIEQSNSGAEVFHGILEAMTELREAVCEEEGRLKEAPLLKEIKNSDQPDQTDQTNQISQTDQSDQTGRTSQTSQIGQTDQSNQIDQTGQADQSDQIDQTGQADQPDQTGRTSRTSQISQTDQTGQISQTDQTDQPDQLEQTIRSKWEAVENYEDLREASMRREIRDVLRKGYERIAVVCGAWHAPVLDLLTKEEKRKKLIPTKKEDDALLSRLTKIRTTVTWCPWTCSKLASRSGYGAGVESPGWYDLLWRYPENPTPRWITLAARLLRKKGIDVSAANVIEAVRLAETLAVMRNRAAPALAEMNDAVLTVLCQGSSSQWDLFRQQLEVGSVIGSVPENAPMVPLQRDIEKEQKRLRLKLTEEILFLDLDLRKENDRAKSRLLHRLLLLGIPWGELQRNTRKSLGSFHEIWQIEWHVEFVVRIIEASVWGSTLEAACTGAIEDLLQSVTSLLELTQLLERALPAEVPPEALEMIFTRLENDAAVSSDIGGLMTAIPPLVQIIRYGNVRQTERGRVEPVFYALFKRVLVGLIPSCGTLDHAAAEKRILEIDALQTALQTLDRAEVLSDWFDVLIALMNSESIQGLLSGRCCRLVYEQGLLKPEDLLLHFRLSISPAVEPANVAEWLQGFLKGSGQTLLHLDVLWNMLNEWLYSLNSEIFMEMLPVLRRSFSGFTSPELRKMGEKIKKLSIVAGEIKPIDSEETKEKAPELDEKRVAKLLPLLNIILGEN